MIGKRLKTCLSMKGMKQGELARLTGLSEVSISHYIKDQRDPNAKILSEICKVLGISADWLLGLKGERYE